MKQTRLSIDPPPGEGVIYRQDFDDPNDFDLEGYYPWCRWCTTFREAGGVGAADRPVPPGEARERGRLRIEGHENGREIQGGLRIRFPGTDTMIAFDVYVTGAEDFGLIARNLPKPTRFRQYRADQPAPGQWTHYELLPEHFTPYGKSTREGLSGKSRREEEFFELIFYAVASKEDVPHVVLIDNLTVRRAGLAGPLTRQQAVGTP